MRLSEPTVTSYPLGYFDQMPIEILKLTMDKLDLENLEELCSVCSSLRAIVYSLVGYTVLHFSDTFEPQLDLMALHNAHKKPMQLHLFPQIVSIGLGQLQKKSCGTEPSMSSLDTTRHKQPLSGIDTSEIRSLTLSSNGFTDTNQILQFLESYQFSSLRVITLHKIDVSKELLDWCSKKLNLKYFNSVQCSSQHPQPHGYKVLSHTLECVLEPNCDVIDREEGIHFILPINSRKCTIYLSEKNDTLCDEPYLVIFDAFGCKLLEYL